MGEVWAESPAALAEYLRPDELHSAFNFDYMMCPWSAARLRAVIDASLSTAALVGAPATWVLESHDKPRVRTRLALEAAGMAINDRTGRGEDALGGRRGRAATLFMLGLPGSAYLYQGQELGLREVVELPASVRQDPAFARTSGTDGFRDGCRVPMPWTVAGESHGFSPTGRSWLPMPPDWGEASVERQAEDPASMLELTRAALRLRRAEAALGGGPMTWVEIEDPDVLLARRPGGDGAPDVLVAMNLGSRSVLVPSATLLLGSADDVAVVADGVVLPPDASAWLRAG